MKHVTPVLVVGAIGLGAQVILAPTASAAYPTCDGVGDWFHNTLDDYYYTANVPLASNWTISGYDCNLRIGNQGAAVRQLQDVLRGCNGHYIAVDGSFGPGTKEGLEHFQSTRGLVVDGVYGPQTRKAMNWRIWGSTGSWCAKLPVQRY